jgi:hypothetical protein
MNRARDAGKIIATNSDAMTVARVGLPRRAAIVMLLSQ